MKITKSNAHKIVNPIAPSINGYINAFWYNDAIIHILIPAINIHEKPIKANIVKISSPSIR